MLTNKHIQAVNIIDVTMTIEILVQTSTVIVQSEFKREGKFIVVGKIRNLHIVIDFIKTHAITKITYDCSRTTNYRTVVSTHHIISIAIKVPIMCCTVIAVSDNIIKGVATAKTIVWCIDNCSITIIYHGTIRRHCRFKNGQRVTICVCVIASQIYRCRCILLNSKSIINSNRRTQYCLKISLCFFTWHY